MTTKTTNINIIEVNDKMTRDKRKLLVRINQLLYWHKELFTNKELNLIKNRKIEVENQLKNNKQVV